VLTLFFPLTLLFFVPVVVRRGATLSVVASEEAVVELVPLIFLGTVNWVNFTRLALATRLASSFCAPIGSASKHA
jgi:ABC-type transporter Mla maintaining outer membrane lipid asymmetry permease subunit MlaE